MKPQSTGPRSKGAGFKGRPPMRIPQIPMEWMDPMSWRLPSGRALAEFWLDTGFLAPLMLGGPAIKGKKKSAQIAPEIAEKSAKEAPERSGTFRGTR